MTLVDEILVSDDAQLNGIVFICDHREFTFNHARMTTKDTITSSLKIYQVTDHRLNREIHPPLTPRKNILQLTCKYGLNTSE
jgi:hypothetical protein